MTTPHTKTSTSVPKLIASLTALLYRYKARNPRDIDNLPAEITDLIDALNSLQSIVTTYQNFPELPPDERELLECLEDLESKIKCAPYYNDESLYFLNWPLKKGEEKEFIERIEEWEKKENIKALVDGKDSQTLDYSNEIARNQAFSAAITSIQSQPKDREDLAIKIICWLARGRAAITVSQLQIAVSLVPGQYKIDESSLPTRETLLEVCSGLVTIDTHNDRIRLIHYSLPAYLLEHSIVPADADATISIACLTYLMFPTFSEAAHTSENMEARNTAYPFLWYASVYLRYHLAAASAYEEATAEALMALLNSPNICSYQEAQYSSKGKYYRPHLNSLSPLQFACGQLAHLTVAKRLLADGVDVNSEDTYDKRTPLNFAVFNRHEKCQDFVTLLLDNGASLEVFRGSNQTALHVASHYGIESVVRLLLKRFSDEKLLEKYGAKCIYWAAYNQHESVVRIFLENGVKPDTCEREFEDPENWGAKRLEKYNEDCTPLHMACNGWSPSIVALLLQYGADIKRVGVDGFTALHYVANRRKDILEADPQVAKVANDMIKVLLENGADVNVVDNNGRTPLSIAAGAGCSSIVEGLLLGGADARIVDEEGKTAREWAEAGGYNETVEMINREGWQLVAKE